MKDFDEQPTAVVPVTPAPTKSMAAWAEAKGHIRVRKPMSLRQTVVNGRRMAVSDPGVRRAAPHVYGAASLVRSARGVKESFEKPEEYRAALMATVVTEAEYDAAVTDYQSIVLR